MYNTGKIVSFDYEAVDNGFQLDIWHPEFAVESCGFSIYRDNVLVKDIFSQDFNEIKSIIKGALT